MSSCGNKRRGPWLLNRKNRIKSYRLQFQSGLISIPFFNLQSILQQVVIYKFDANFERIKKVKKFIHLHLTFRQRDAS